MTAAMTSWTPAETWMPEPVHDRDDDDDGAGHADLGRPSTTHRVGDVRRTEAGRDRRADRDREEERPAHHGRRRGCRTRAGRTSTRRRRPGAARRAPRTSPPAAPRSRAAPPTRPIEAGPAASMASAGQRDHADAEHGGEGQRGALEDRERAALGERCRHASASARADHVRRDVGVRVGRADRRQRDPPQRDVAAPDAGGDVVVLVDRTARRAPSSTPPAAGGRVRRSRPAPCASAPAAWRPVPGSCGRRSGRARAPARQDRRRPGRDR